MEGLPGLSVRARRLLLEGDVEGRYHGRSGGDSGYRLTMAIAVAVSQPGREWTPAQWWEALVLRPTAGGAWARSLRTSKGDRYAEAKLGEMLVRARRFVGRSGAVTCRADALVEIARVREAVERTIWRGTSGGVDERHLAARLELAQRAGGLEHHVSVRQLAELIGCARSTAEASNERLEKAGWLVRRSSQGGPHASGAWTLRIPAAAGDDARAAPGHPPAQGGRGAGGDPGMHTAVPAGRDTLSLARIQAHDAFHHHAHAGTGARLLSCLDPVEGRSPQDLAAALGVHRTTVRRRLDRLAADGLVVEADGLVYLPAALTGHLGVQADEELLDRAAQERGTAGRGEQRREAHARQREAYRILLDLRARRREERRAPARPPLRLVPEGVVDPVSGELLDDAWAGWDVRDPGRPVWVGAPERGVRAVSA
ncbi:MarR family transcriptional regulator [Kitasatospora sp. cg17-2]